FTPIFTRPSFVKGSIFWASPIALSRFRRDRQASRIQKSRTVSSTALIVSGRIDVYVVPGCGEQIRLFPTIAPNTGGFSFDRVAAASGWYWPAYTWKVPVGSETRARHIGCPAVPTFSTSVITPTTKTRFTFAPSGVTMYEGGRSPVPSASKFASLYS